MWGESLDDKLEGWRGNIHIDSADEWKPPDFKLNEYNDPCLEETTQIYVDNTRRISKKQLFKVSLVYGIPAVLGISVLAYLIIPHIMQYGLNL